MSAHAPIVRDESGLAGRPREDPRAQGPRRGVRHGGLDHPCVQPGLAHGPRPALDARQRRGAAALGVGEEGEPRRARPLRLPEDIDDELADGQLTWSRRRPEACRSAPSDGRRCPTTWPTRSTTPTRATRRRRPSRWTAQASTSRIWRGDAQGRRAGLLPSARPRGHGRPRRRALGAGQPGLRPGRALELQGGQMRLVLGRDRRLSAPHVQDADRRVRRSDDGPADEGLPDHQGPGHRRQLELRGQQADPAVHASREGPLDQRALADAAEGRRARDGVPQVHRVLPVPGRVPRAARARPARRLSTARASWSGSPSLEMHPKDVLDRRPLLKGKAGVGYCNITKCCTEVCPEHIKITDNAIIPLKERMDDVYFDPIASDRPPAGPRVPQGEPGLTDWPSIRPCRRGTFGPCRLAHRARCSLHVRPPFGPHRPPGRGDARGACPGPQEVVSPDR